MTFRGACLLLLLTAAAPAGAQDWVALSDDCLDRLGRADAAADTLAAVCPALTEALRADPWNDLLIEPAGELSAWSVIQLSAMAEHYTGSPPGTRVDTAGLDPVIAGLPDAAAQAPPSLWERVWEWLSGWADDSADALPEWVSDYALPDGSAQWILYGSVALVVLLAASIIANEVRHRSHRRGHTATPGGAGSGAAGATASASLAARSPGEQLEALFRELVASLTDAGVLPRRPSLTHREVAAAALPEDRARAVGAVSAAAERAVYGGWQPAADEVRPHLDAGRRLLDELGGQP